MKKLIYLSAAVIALALTGCNGESLSNKIEKEFTIEAVMADNDGTKTVIQDGSTSVLWEPGDEIKVFYDGTGSRFGNQYTEPSGTAKFSGSLSVVFGSNEGFSDDTPIYGLYPYRADATADNSSVTTTLPAEQNGKAGSFAKGMNITLGKSSSLRMGFYNVCGGIRFTLTQEGIKEVVFQGQNDEDLAGKVKLAFSDNIPVVSEVVEGVKSITLTAPNGGTFETGKWYYIVALPGTLSKGFKMTFNTDTQYATLKSSRSNTIKRGIFGSLADADEDLVFRDKGTEPPATGNIVFADAAAKYACVAKYDTNGDGEVSIEEAEAATSFSDLFDDWKTVASFDEIVYFKNVHSISGLFNGCNKLVSITIPENITDLGTNAFDGCSSLTSVTLPSNITAIGNYTFQKCTSLGSITLPSNVTSIGQYAFFVCTALSSVGLPSELLTIGHYAFYNCYALNSIDLPNKLNIIGQCAFSGCTSLTHISIPNGVTSLGTYAFFGCTELTTANIPSGISSIPAYCFKNCSKLESVTVPSGITSVGNYAFTGVKMWKLELPSSITSLGSACLGDIVCVILPSNSPISIQSDTFDGVPGIFVPSNLIEMYKAMTNWSSYSHKLHPISLYKDKALFVSDAVLGTSGAIDMGTSVKWAAYNVGASSPEEYGDYYAWGEVATKSKYNWSTYLDSPSRDGNSFTKYYNNGGKTKLDPENDAAHVKWGESWRMPTDDEWRELKEQCYWEWTTHNSINGRMVYSFDTGYKIFLPAAGSRDGTNLSNVGSVGIYWSSSLCSGNSKFAWHVEFSSSDVGRYNYYRYYGKPVRPVCD